MSLELSLEQRRAVERSGQDVCVVAGPGSGKTRVLTERFAWLVEDQGVDPTRILAITFTEKAAIEIKQRLVTRFAARPDLREPIERAWVSTIHGFCTRLLKEHAIEAGLAPDFVVLEQAAALRFEREAAETALDELFAEHPAEMRRLLEAMDLSTQDDGRQTDLAKALLEVYEAKRVSGGGTEPRSSANESSVVQDARRVAESFTRGPVGGALGRDVQQWAAAFLRLPDLPGREHLQHLAAFTFHLGRFKHPDAARFKNDLLPRLESEWIAAYYSGLDALLHEALDRLDASYLALKRRQSAVDFSDLESFTVALLESDASVRYETHARFDEILMDELQDTNRVQWCLVSLLHTRLFAVGDINQSIYGFRSADPQVFSEYRATLRDAGAEIDELRGNYRSRPEILAAVSSALDAQPGIEPRPLEALATFPPSHGPAVELLIGRGDDASEIEASLVAARIREWRDAGAFQYSDMAVLVRTIAAMEPFEAAFDRFGIPFLVSGGRGFLEARETLDINLLLAALVNPLDEIALIGVLRSPMVGLRDEAFLAMNRDAWQAEFEARFGELRRMAGFLAPDLLIARALDASNYTAQLTERARANVDKLLAWMRREHRHRPRPLAELLEDLEALRKSETLADAPPPETGDVVRMMTIHAAKGLEFPVVFVAALHKGTDNKSAPLLYSPEAGLGVKWRHPITSKGISDPIRRALKDAVKAREQAEEDRLLYVAMTRAMNRLVLSSAERKRASKWQQLVASGVAQVTLADEAPRPPSSVSTATPNWPLSPGPWPLPIAQYDSTVSATSVAIFTACPRRYFLSRYLMLDPEPAARGTGATELGLSVHRALAGEPAESEAAAELTARFHASDLGQRAARAQRIEREFDFLFETNDVIVRGQIDLWFEEGGELIVVDYKTGRDSPGYALQLRLYALALERYAGRIPDRAFLYYPQSDQTIEVSLTPADLDAARSAVLALREAQDKLEFPLHESDQCQKCLFRGGVCPVGRGTEEGVNLGLVSLPPSSFPGPARDGF